MVVYAYSYSPPYTATAEAFDVSASPAVSFDWVDGTILEDARVVHILCVHVPESMSKTACQPGLLPACTVF